MKKYIGEVMQVRDADLQQTRDQILKCFEKIDCFLLPHPGKIEYLSAFSHSFV